MRRGGAPIALAAAFLLYVAAADEFVGFGLDDAHYVIQARRFARGDPELYSPYFPVGYPALLAIPARLAPGVAVELALDKAISALFAAGAVLLAFRLAERRLGASRRYAAVLAVLTALNPRWAHLAVQVLAEAPFAFFSLLFLDRYLAAREAPRVGPGALLALAGALAAAVAMRTIGVGLLVAAALDQGLAAVRGGSVRRGLALVGAPALALGLWCGFVDRALPYQFAWKIYPGHERSVQGWQPPAESLPVRTARSLAANAWREVAAANLPALDSRAVARLEASPAGAALVALVRAGLLALLVLGLAERWARGRVVVFYWLVSLAVLSIQIWPVGKFLVPLTPISLDLVLAGALAAGRRLGRPALGRAALALVALAAGASSVYRDAAAIRDARTGGGASGAEYSRALLAELDEVSRRVEPDARVGLSWPSPHVGLVYHPVRPVHVPVLRIGELDRIDYVLLQPYDPERSLADNLGATWGAATPEEVARVAARAELARESPCRRFRLYRLSGAAGRP